MFPKSAPPGMAKIVVRVCSAGVAVRNRGSVPLEGAETILICISLQSCAVYHTLVCSQRDNESFDWTWKA